MAEGEEWEYRTERTGSVGESLDKEMILFVCC